MSFKKEIIPLNLALDTGAKFSDPFLLPPCSDFSLQVFSSCDQSVNTVVSLHQSNDGMHFDPVVDLADSNVQIEINDATPTATLNVSNLCTLWLRLLITPPEGEGEDGSISYAILTSN
jgi:hypothetical protein